MLMVLRRLYPEFVAGRVGLGLLVLRIFAGVALMVHGWGKIQQPFSWMKGGGQPAFAQAFAAGGEFIAGAMLVVGFLTPFAALWAMAVMFGAWWIVHRNDPWINPGGKSYELASVYFLMALALLLTGPGRHALDYVLFGKRLHDVPDERMPRRG